MALLADGMRTAAETLLLQLDHGLKIPRALDGVTLVLAAGRRILITTFKDTEDGTCRL
jgi:hypothetical protein